MASAGAGNGQSGRWLVWARAVSGLARACAWERQTVRSANRAATGQRVGERLVAHAITM